jgi:hypothetical protein
MGAESNRARVPIAVLGRPRVMLFSGILGTKVSLVSRVFNLKIKISPIPVLKLRIETPQSLASLVLGGKDHFRHHLVKSYRFTKLSQH